MHSCGDTIRELACKLILYSKKITSKPTTNSRSDWVDLNKYQARVDSALVHNQVERNKGTDIYIRAIRYMVCNCTNVTSVTLDLFAMLPVEERM